VIAISFVVHNQLHYTKTFIDSIAKNSYPHHLGVVAVDNASSDGSWEWLSSLNFNPYVKIRNDKNESLSKAWNQALRASLEMGAELICLANNDLQVGPGWLDAITAQHRKGEKSYWLPNGSLSPDRLEEARTLPKTGGTRPGRAGWCLFFPAEAARLILPLPEELRLWYGDDWIHWKLGREGYRCFTADDCYVYHFGSKTVQAIQAAGPIQAIIDKDRETYYKLTGERL
jgi:GT2 family glycosyltransferase